MSLSSRGGLHRESTKLLPKSLMIDCLATISGAAHSMLLTTSLIGDFLTSGEAKYESDPNALYRFYLWSGVSKRGRAALEFIWLNSAEGW